MGYRLVDVPEPLASTVLGWLDETVSDDVWLCGVPPEVVPDDVLVVTLDRDTQWTRDLLRHAVAWARERQGLRREVVSERERATEILATVSHEMRNPITVLNFMAQLAADARVKPEQKQAHLATLQSTARNLLTLLNDVLDFARLGKGAVALSMSDFSLRKCLEDALIGQRLVAEDKGLTLDWELASPVPEALVGDPGRLRQILVNLVGNAVKFTSQGGVRVEVGWEDPDRLQISVHDTGIGMTPEQLGRIFDPYTQAAATTTKRYGGTGLGLTITRQLVELMQGTIVVMSQPGSGTTFGCTLHLERPLASARAEADESRLEGLPVLVFSHHPLVAQSLKGCGVVQVTVESPEEVLARSGEGALVVFDLGVQQVEPFEWVARLRTQDEAVKIVVFTTAGQRGDALRCQELGVSAYLTEPLELADWREALALTLAGTERGLITRHLLRERR